MLGTPATIRAQSAAVGVVELPRVADTVAVPGVRVLLHRVAGDSQGPIDSTITDDRGRFRFQVHADTGAEYLLSAMYAGIEHFSNPEHADPALPDAMVRILVFDTSSTAPVKLASRAIVVGRPVGRPGETGARPVLEVIVLRNDGSLARVAGDSTRPTWGMELPAGSSRAQLGEGDFSPEAMTSRGDSVLLFAPIGPGARQLMLEYRIPGGQSAVDFPLDTGVMVSVLVEESGADVRGGTLAPVDSELVATRWFHRWSGRIVEKPGVRLTFWREESTPRQLLAGLVAGVALALGFAGWRVAARRVARPQPAAPDQLIETLAELDARYAGRESEVPADEWSRYREERARLKAALETALAAVSASR